MNELDSSVEPDELPRVSGMLAEARKAKGLSQEDVASQLFLTATMIRQIDEGQFQVLGKTAYIRGYLRTYAKVVGLSEDTVVAAFNEIQQVEVDTTEVHELVEEPVGVNRFTGPVVQTGLIGLALVLLVMLLVWIFADNEDANVGYRPADIEASVAEAGQREPPGLPSRELVVGGVKVSNETAVEVSTDVEAASPATVLTSTADRVKPTPTQSKVAQTRVVPTAQAPIRADGQFTEKAALEKAALEQAVAKNPMVEDPVVEDPMVEDPVVEDPVAETGLADAAVADIETNSTADQPLSLPMNAASFTRVSQGAGSLITVSTAGDDKLEFNFTDECWIEVFDAVGDQVYGDLNRTGDTLVVVGTAPFRVLFGKAPAAQLVFNGQRVSLDRYTRADLTATIKLPR
ncbi:DUF4115 domain-containing protein [Pseudomonadales bacterium]|nr:DUF4115 domain-containing protein [Pseudomonadales bacterium]